MKHYHPIKYSWGLLILIGLIAGCSRDNPKAIWNPEFDASGSPTISRIEPDGTERFYDMEISIIGSGFSPILEENRVYFNNEPAEILSASPEKIVVRRPKIIGDSIAIKVVVDGQVVIAEYSPYKIEPIVEELGRFSLSNVIYGLAVDKDENVYAFHKGSIIFKITPENEKTEFATATSARGESMRIGPDGGLYFPGKIGKNKGISRIPADGGEEVLIHENRRPFICIDFDKNGDLYASGKKVGLWRINVETGEGTEIPIFENFSIFDLKFTNDAVYGIGSYSGGRNDLPEEGIYRSLISPDGTFGQEEAVIDWRMMGEFSADTPLGFALAENGDIYIGTTGENPIVIARNNGSIEALYPSLMVPAAGRLVWGNDQSLYMMRTNDAGQREGGRIYRIATPSKGVPYYGRQ